MKIELNPEIVCGLWDYMCRTHVLKVKSKSNSCLCKIIRPFTGLSKKVWKKVSTLLGRTLYTDIKPGIETEDTSLLGHCALITHECQHRIQNDLDPAYPLKYAFSKRKRMEYEVDAYTCNMELYRELTNDLIPIDAILDKLRLYKLSESLLEAARVILKRRSEMVWKYGAITKAGKEALWYLYQYQITSKLVIRMPKEENKSRVLL